jgi:hypothetical protein
MLDGKQSLTTLEISSGDIDMDASLLGDLATRCPNLQHLGLRCSMFQDAIEKGTFSKGFLKKLNALAIELAKFPALADLTFAFRLPWVLAKFQYGKQYPINTDRYMLVSHILYHLLVRAASKANTCCTVKKICLSVQLARICRTDKSFRIKCAAEHVFDY